MRPFTRPVAALALAALTLTGVSLLGAPAARADSLREAFLDLSTDSRRAVQAELARAELYMAPADGYWSSSTDRALRRGADKVTQVTRGRVHPNLNRPEGVQLYLTALESGRLSSLLYPVKDDDNGLFNFLKGN